MFSLSIIYIICSEVSNLTSICLAFPKELNLFTNKYQSDWKFQKLFEQPACLLSSNYAKIKIINIDVYAGLLSQKEMYYTKCNIENVYVVQLRVCNV
jgi:hypothetical protein